MNIDMNLDTYDCIVIGAGQTGLSVGYKLQKSKLNFLILDTRDETTGSYGSYYDSLTLFSPVAHSQLPGYALEGNSKHYPSREEFIAYLQRYHKHFDLPVLHSTRVLKVEKDETGFIIETGKDRYRTATVVNATGPFSDPLMPHYPGQEDFKGLILHAYAYKKPDDFLGKRVIIVGSGNSAVQIADELKDLAEVTIASRRKIKWVNQKILGVDIHWWMHLLGIDHFPLKSKPKGGIPVIDTSGYRKALKAGKFTWRPMFRHFTEEGVVWPDGEEEKTDVVLYATGYEPKLEWLKELDIFDETGRLKHKRGVATEVPGLYYAGFFLQRNAASGNVRGTAYDAEYVARRVLVHLGRRKRAAWLDAWQVGLRQRVRKMD